MTMLQDNKTTHYVFIYKVGLTPFLSMKDANDFFYGLGFAYKSYMSNCARTGYHVDPIESCKSSALQERGSYFASHYIRYLEKHSFPLVEFYYPHFFVTDGDLRVLGNTQLPHPFRGTAKIIEDTEEMLDRVLSKKKYDDYEFRDKRNRQARVRYRERQREKRKKEIMEKQIRYQA